MTTIKIMRGRVHEDRPSSGINAYLKAVAKHRQNAFVALLGINQYETRELIEMEKRGLPYAAFTKFCQVTNISKGRFSHLLSIPYKTLNRRKAQKHFDSKESGRLIRITRVFGMAIELFDGDKDEARDWLNSSLEALGNKTPFEMCQSELGAREVEELIGRLEHGVFS